MKHIIDGIEVDIEWEAIERSEKHDSGCENWIMTGEDENGVKYFGDGNYQHDELIEVTDIELQSKLGFN